MTRMLGPSGSARRRRTLLGAFTSFLLLSMLIVPNAFAVHDDGLFELDRNAVDDGLTGAAGGEDWNLICPAGTPAGAASCIGGTTANKSFWTVDDNRIYTGGSTKDDLDIPGWRHSTGSVPDKDELLHGYAARYGDHLYFGADRAAANGDAQIGVWFFQSAVGPITTGTDAGKFSGAHLDGDLLVLSDFTKGGGKPTVRVFRWNGPGGTIAGSGAIDGTLDLLFGTTATPQDCVGPPPVATGDPACATVNADNQNSPWAYQAKENGSPSGVFPKGHFYEGGVDLSDPLLNLAGECFSSVILETRSSQSVDAVLKDFVAGTFESCGVNISIAEDDVNGIGEPHTFTVTVTKTVNGVQTGVEGAFPDVTLTPTGGASVDAGSLVDTCADDGINTGTDANGQCTVTFTSLTAGVITGHASVTVTLGGSDFTAETDGLGGNTGDAVKEFVAGSLTWTKVDKADGSLLGGATFEVCRTDTLDSSTDPDSFVDEVPDVCVTVPDDVDGTTAAGDVDRDPDPGEFLLDNLVLGKYTITETVPPPDYATDPSPKNATLDLSNLPASANVDVGAFEDERLFKIIIITCNQTQNSLVDGEVALDGTTTDTITSVPANLAALGVTQADLCGIGGAAYGDLAAGTYGPTVEVPDQPPLHP